MGTLWASHFYFYEIIMRNYSSTNISVQEYLLYYSLINKDWSTDTCYNLDEPWKHSKQKKSRHKRPHIVWFHLYEMSRKGKSVETENNQWLPRSDSGRRGWGEMGSDC